jgi:hypothetical protein
MKLTSREISKELHNACFKGEPCGGYYAEGGFTRNLEGKPKPDYLAYDLETILEALPMGVFMKDQNESLASTAARLWLKLKEHNLI